MSFMIVAGLLAECPACRAIRRIPREGGPALMQVGDPNVRVQAELQRHTDQQDGDLFHVAALCPACAPLRLASRPQELAGECDSLLEGIAEWDEALRRRCLDRILEELAPGEDPAGAPSAWLRQAFPALYRACFEDPRCRLYPEFLLKMKKRFRTQACRSIERDGVPVPEGFGPWLRVEAKRHPFAQRIQALRARVEACAREIPPPWHILESVDPWQGVNLNPYLQSEQTIFRAAGEPETPLHLEVETDPEEVVAICETALRQPLDTGGYVRDGRIEAMYRERVCLAVEDVC